MTASPSLTETSVQPIVVLVHGAWHGAWCWAALQAELDRRGIASLAVDLPGHGASTAALTDMYGDAAHVADVVSRIDRPVVLVGHSYGGAVITEAATTATGVAHLVYLAAFAIDGGESIMSLLGGLPPAEVALSAAVVPGDDGNATIDPAGATAAFYGSCPIEVVRAALPRLSPQPLVTFGQPATGNPRSAIASTYLCCTLDQAVSIVHQQVMSQRCTHTVTFETDHSPFVSMPGATADLIAGVVNGLATGGNDVKVRIGYGFGVRTKLNDAGFATVVDALERLRFDSLWLSERLGGDAPDPLVAMSFAAGRTTKLKFGMSVMVLPGRNPVVLAKELATLDRLSQGRVLPAFGLGVADPHEQQAFGVERGERAAWFDESMAVLRACWSGSPVTHHGQRYHFDDLKVLPLPQQQHLDVWLGGIAPSELRRVGRLADGWLPSFVTPADAARGREIIEHTAAEHGRSIEDDHYGALIPYAHGPVPDALLAGLAKRRPDLADPAVLVPSGWDALMTTIDAFVAVGTTKFVILPLVEPADPDAWVAHLEEAAPIVLARQT